MRALAQLEEARDVVDDVLDRALRVEELPAHLGRVETLGEQAIAGSSLDPKKSPAEAALRKSAI